MNTRILSAIVVVTAVVLCQQVHAQAENDSEDVQVTELEGTWELVSCLIGGEQGNGVGLLWRFEGNRLYYRKGDDGDWKLERTFFVNPSAMPAEIEFLGQVDFLGQVITNPRILGIYEIDGDSLTICMASTRPGRFESSEDYSTLLLVFRRVEEDNE